jgi:hypothetical protein
MLTFSQQRALSHTSYPYRKRIKKAKIVKNGRKMFILAGCPTKQQLILVYGKRGPRMNWAQRAATGIDAEHFQEALEAKRCERLSEVFFNFFDEDKTEQKKESESVEA